MKKRHPLEARPDAVPAVAAAAFVGSGALASILYFLHGLVPPVAWNDHLDAPIVIGFESMMKIARDGWADAPHPSLFHLGLDPVLHLVAYIFDASVNLGVLPICLISFLAAMSAAVICGKIIYRAVYRGLPPVRNVTTVIGQAPLYGVLGAEHINKAWEDRRAAVGDGVALAPGVIMPRDVEAEHIAVLGTTGAGKSTVVEGILRQAIRRGDRALIIDVKGDARKRFGLRSANELGLGSRRGPIWAIGRDIRNRRDAIELAAVLVPPSKEPIWSDGSRLYLVGLIVALQRRLGRGWGWSDLSEALAKPFPEQERLIKESMPDIVNLLQTKDGDPTTTVMSLLVTIIANVGSIAWTLAEKEKSGGPSLSLRSWAAGKAKTKVIFLRLEFDFDTQSAAFLKLALRCVQSTLFSGEVKDGVDHALWLGFDELPRYIDDQTVERLVALGRSRGVRVVAALQVPAQLRRTLSADATDALLGNFGLQIVSRVAPGPSRAEIARDWFGMRTVTWDPTLTGGKPDQEWPTREIPVLSQAELSGVLGKYYSGTGRSIIRAAVTGFEQVPILSWPIGWAD